MMKDHLDELIKEILNDETGLEGAFARTYIEGGIGAIESLVDGLKSAGTLTIDLNGLRTYADKMKALLEDA
jgi:hypothetical protein